jgi:glucose/arabinose dehydrogenase
VYRIPWFGEFVYSRPYPYQANCLKINLLMLKKLLFSMLLIAGIPPGHCISQPTPILENFISGFTHPVKVTHANDSRLFVAEIGGKIKIIKNGVLLTEPFLDIGNKVNDPEWAGILSIAFAPDYQTSGRCYVLYLPKNSLQVQLSLFQTTSDNTDKADENSEVKILTIPYGDLADGHRGGDIAFDKDGYMYVSTGDNGPGSRGMIGDPGNNSQNLGVLFGKILRLDPGTSALVENPLSKIFALGLRNPWRMSFDRQSGDLWIGDNGQDSWEEINYVKYPFDAAVYNFGWSCKEGNASYTESHCTDGTTYIPPKLVYPGYSQNGTYASASVMGGYVYRGSSYPALAGYYFFGDYSSGKIGYANSAGAGGFFSDISLSSIVSFGEDQLGGLYALSLGAGTLSKIKASGASLPVRLESISAKVEACIVNVQWRTGDESNFSHFELERSKDLKAFESITAINATGPNSLYRYTDPSPFSTPFYYRLKMIDENGTFAYSSIIVVMMNCTDKASLVAPNPTRGNFTISQNGQRCDVRIFNNAGILVSTSKLAADKMGRFNLTDQPAGMYHIQIFGNSGLLIDVLNLVKQ